MPISDRQCFQILLLIIDYCTTSNQTRGNVESFSMVVSHVSANPSVKGYNDRGLYWVHSCIVGTEVSMYLFSHLGILVWATDWDACFQSSVVCDWCIVTLVSYMFMDIRQFYWKLNTCLHALTLCGPLKVTMGQS